MSALLSAHTGFRTPEERAAFDDGVAAQLARLGIDRWRDERSESGGDVDARLARSRARARLNRRWALKESASSREDYNDFPRTERYTTTTSCGLSRDVASRACRVTPCTTQFSVSQKLTPLARSMFLEFAELHNVARRMRQATTPALLLVNPRR